MSRYKLPTIQIDPESGFTVYPYPLRHSSHDATSLLYPGGSDTVEYTLDLSLSIGMVVFPVTDRLVVVVKIFGPDGSLYFGGGSLLYGGGFEFSGSYSGGSIMATSPIGSVGYCLCDLESSWRP